MDGLFENGGVFRIELPDDFSRDVQVLLVVVGPESLVVGGGQENLLRGNEVMVPEGGFRLAGSKDVLPAQEVTAVVGGPYYS